MRGSTSKLRSIASQREGGTKASDREFHTINPRIDCFRGYIFAMTRITYCFVRGTSCHKAAAGKCSTVQGSIGVSTNDIPAEFCPGVGFRVITTRPSVFHQELRTSHHLPSVAERWFLRFASSRSRRPICFAHVDH